MKYLLVAVNAKYIHSNLAVYDLAAYARRELADDQNVQIEIAEYTINHRTDYILHEIYQHKPDVIAFSCYIWNIRIVEEVLVELKKILPDASIWAGGPEVSYRGTSFLKQYPQVDLVLCGEGEKIFTEAVQRYEKGERFQSMQIACKEPLPLDEVPFIYEDFSLFEHKILYYESSRGCPFSCSYCLSSIDKKLRYRSLPAVLSHIQCFLDHKVPQVKFVDRTFNADRRFSLAVWKHILEHDNGITNFHFEIAADLLTEDALEVMAKMRKGLIQLEIGVQSTNPQTVKEIHRVMDFEKVADITRRIEKNGNIHAHLDLIAGLPYEDYDRFAKSFCDVYAVKPNQLQLGFLKLLSGSYMRDHAKDYGMLFRHYAPYEILSTNWMSYEDMERIKQVEEVVELYYNSHQYENTITVLEGEFETSFEMFQRLGAYYQKRSEGDAGHSRITRYEILRDFIRNIPNRKVSLEAYTQLLVLDLYLRENCKSRPAFADDQNAYKNAFRDFYKEEEQNRKYLPAYADYHARQLASMTHIEVFTVDMKKLVSEGIEEKRTCIILFSYKDKDVLSGNARILEVSADENIKKRESK